MYYARADVVGHMVLSSRQRPCRSLLTIQECLGNSEDENDQELLRRIWFINLFLFSAEKGLKFKDNVRMKSCFCGIVVIRWLVNDIMIRWKCWNLKEKWMGNNRQQMQRQSKIAYGEMLTCDYIKTSAHVAHSVLSSDSAFMFSRVWSCLLH